MATRFAIETVFKATDMISGTMRRMTRSVMKGGESMEAAFKGVAKSSAKAAGAIAGIGGATFAGVAALSSADAQAQKLAKSVGLSVDLAEQMAAASAGAGFEFDNIIDLAEEMNNKLGESAGLKELTPVTESLQILGLSFKKIKDLSPEDQFKAITNAALAMEDGQKAAAAADILMGGEANKLIGVLRQQGKTLDDVTGKYSDLSIRSEESRKGAADFTAELSGVKFGAFGALKEMSGLLAAELTPALKTLSKWMSENREQIAAFVKTAAKALGRLAKTISAGLMDGINDLKGSDVGAFFKKATSTASGLEESIDGVFDVVRKTAATISTFVQVMVYAGAATLAYRAALVASSVASNIMTAKTVAMTVATSAWSAVTKAASAGMAVLRGALLAVNLAMYANPIGLVIAAVVALIAAVALMVTQWDTVAAFFTDLWGGIVAAFSAAAAKISDIFGTVTDLFGSAGDLVNFDGMFDGLVTSAEEALGDIMGMFAGVQDAFGSVGDFFGFGDDTETPAPRAPVGQAPGVAGDGVASPQEGVMRSINENKNSAEVTLRNDVPNTTAEPYGATRGMNLNIMNSGAF